MANNNFDVLNELDDDNNPLNLFVQLNDNITPEELRARRLAMMMDVPNEPPVNLNNENIENEDMDQDQLNEFRPRKRRGLYTLVSPDSFGIHIQMSDLISNCLRALQEARPTNRMEFFSEYLMRHMNSRNYPNGEGLPPHWGEL